MFDTLTDLTRHHDTLTNEYKYRYRVESGIPLLPRRIDMGGRFNNGYNIYPWPIMNKNNSFFVPHEDFNGDKTVIAHAIASRKLRCPDEQYAWRTRYPDQHNEHGWRVWRVG